jgi:RNA polymerase sigma-70 factor (ECF subfamily)
MPPSEQARWFAEEVKPYEPALRAYLSKRFPSLPDHDDLVQETYVRLLRARESGRLNYARALLFTVARNVAIDLFRRRRLVSQEPMGAAQEQQVDEESPDVVTRMETAQRREALLQAVEALPERCRAVMVMRYLNNLSHREIAAELGISMETVKVHQVRGMHECARYFRRHGLIDAKGKATP